MRSKLETHSEGRNEIVWSSGNGEGTGRGDHRHSYLCSPLRNANGLSEERGLVWEAGAPVPIA